jgi:hypothetical protein
MRIVLRRITLSPAPSPVRNSNKSRDLGVKTRRSGTAEVAGPVREPLQPSRYCRGGLVCTPKDSVGFGIIGPPSYISVLPIAIRFIRR